MKKKIILIILVAAALIFAGLAIYDHVKWENAGKGYEEIQEEYKTEVTETPTPVPTTEAAEVTVKPTPEVTEEPTPEPTPEPVAIPVDFTSLQEINPDIYAWITIPNTLVDYPILQNPEDDEYYLHRDVYRNDEFAGSLFTQAAYNTLDFEEDPVTVVYGHNLKNGTMFNSLKYYMDPEFFENNREILVYTPDSVLHYKVFASYIYGDEHLLYGEDFSDPKTLESYIDDIYNVRDAGANLDTEMRETFTEDSKILTLSTCYDANSVQRYLVQAVLVKTEPGILVNLSN